MSRNLALLIAVILGLLAVFLVYKYVQKMHADVYQGMNMVTVLVAADNLEEGTTLTAQNVAFRQYPAKYVATRAITPDAAPSTVGALAKYNLEKGKPILWSDLEMADVAEVGMAEMLQPGMTTFVMPVTDETGVAGALRASQRVDVLYTFDMAQFQNPSQSADVSSAPTDVAALKDYVLKAMARESSSPNDATAVLFQNVLVLGTGSADSDSSGVGADTTQATYDTVTLMVTPEQARMLTFCQDHGKMSLLLRRAGDVQEEQNPGLVTGPAVLRMILDNSGTGATTLQIMN